MEWLMELSHVDKFYSAGKAQVHALEDVSLKVQRGEFLAVVGRSGSGKSTLMNLLGCLDTPTRGSYRLEGTDVAQLDDNALSGIRNHRIGFIFQGFNLIPSLTAEENVELPLIYRRMEPRRRRVLCREALEQVGLEERRRHLPGQMSGGQQQRVAIARAIAAQPPIVLADEPTGNLDSRSGAEVMGILQGLWRRGHTVVLITHDNTVAATARRQVKMADGRVTGDSFNCLDR
ncbi:MAG: ABC transporter ATP-binding protein [Oscillospiraceae bacterium]|nr:ABC transporter ATP-binding protein [Oscillospiraceae bacterium]